MKNTCLGLFIVIAFLYSCNSETKTDTVDGSDSTNINSSAPSTEPVTQSPSDIGTSADIPVNADHSSATQNPVAVAAGMNPAHGQPGHRCDISVGAPLSSAPSTPAVAPQGTGTPLNTQTISTAPTINSSPGAQPPASSAPVSTAPGMNPPHGQPGHDCAIAVGAPLKK